MVQKQQHFICILLCNTCTIAILLCIIIIILNALLAMIWSFGHLQSSVNARSIIFMIKPSLSRQ